jgi:hypothetical protein
VAKFCANGHQMEDSWDVCPYCPRAGYPTGPSTVTVRTRFEDLSLEAGVVGSGRRSGAVADKRKLPVVGWFVALTGQQRGEDFRVREGPNIIGSAPDADIVLRDDAISGKHASLRYKDQKFTITDLDSTNGTYLNDRSDPIAREELKDNDLVRVGNVTLKFKCF